MKWSWRLFKVFGIGVYVHVTFLLLLIWAGWSGFAGQHTLGAALAEIGFIVTLFGIVVLHELGHALMAARFGIQARNIVLLPIGGIASIERFPGNPRQEIVIASIPRNVQILIMEK